MIKKRLVEKRIVYPWLRITLRRCRSVSREVIKSGDKVGENSGLWGTPVAKVQQHPLFLVRVPRFCPRLQPPYATLIGEHSVVFDRRFYRPGRISTIAFSPRDDSVPLPFFLLLKLFPPLFTIFFSSLLFSSLLLFLSFFLSFFPISFGILD